MTETKLSQPLSRWDQIWFTFRASVLRSLRNSKNLRRALTVGQRVAETNIYGHTLASYVGDLSGSDVTSDDQVWRRGKIRNLRLACEMLDGRRFLAGEEFSFWAVIGPPTTSRGFAMGREVRSGCIIPTVGGGLCQFSTALFQAAVESGFEITEHHMHSNARADSRAGATVFYNYVDLKFKFSREALIGCKVIDDQLRLEFRAKQPAVNQSLVPSKLTPRSESTAPLENCLSCNRDACQSRPKFLKRLTSLQPLNVRDSTEQFPKWRKLGLRIRQRLLMRSQAERSIAESEWIANRLACKVRTHYGPLQIAQRLLPHLYLRGVLAGKDFSVHLRFLPLAEMQHRLNLSARAYPAQGRWSEYRVPQKLIEAEQTALGLAKMLTTTHTEVARITGAVLHDPKTPYPKFFQRKRKRSLLFPGPLTWREGVLLSAQIARALNLRVIHFGSQVEDVDFFVGLDAQPTDRQSLDWDDIGVLVHPTVFESSPTLYHQALSAGVPVVVSRGAGLLRGPGCFILDENLDVKLWIDTLTQELEFQSC